MFLVALATLLAVLLLWFYVSDWGRLRTRPRVVVPAEPPVAPPLVSLLVPARNEERAIERCVTGALAQRYSQFELLVVDDGSTDRTPALLAEFVADPRLRVLSGRPLPAGWVGKCNACQQLSEAARGEWLLFLDADTAPQPELIAALLQHARRHQLDLVTIFPFLELGSFWERAMLPPFVALITAIFPLERMARAEARPDEVLANGQCIFVRRAAYAAIGGHGAVRGEVLEDVRLAQAIRAAGFRVGGGEGLELLRVRMYTNGREVAEGLAKHAAAGYRTGGSRSWWAVLRQLAATFGPFWLLGGGVALLGWGELLLGGVLLGLGLLTGLAALTLWAGLYRRLYRLGPLHALLWPLGLLAYLLTATRGMWQVRSGRGVRWKGRTYAG